MNEYTCTKCGARFVGYAPRCNECHAWSTLRVREAPTSRALGIVYAARPDENVVSLPEPVASTSTEIPNVPRVLTGWRALDVLLGGELSPGFAATATYLLAGEPGSGKSALSVEIAGRVALRYPGLSVLYAVVERALEEAAADVRRLEAERPNLFLVHALDADVIASLTRARRCSLLVVDSLQPLAESSADIPRAARVFRELAAELRVPSILVSRLNARGLALGPNDTRHDVGAELCLAWEEGSDGRALTVRKNRFGPSSSAKCPPLYLTMNGRGKLVEESLEVGLDGDKSEGSAGDESEESGRPIIPLAFS